MAVHAPPPRGRPPKTAEENLATRRRIITAAGRVYAAHGHRGVTVARIIAAAGLSRGLFYKHFRNAIEPVELLMKEVHEGLVPGILLAAALRQDPEDRIAAGIDAYLDWADGLGPLVGPLSAELHDPDSPVFPIRAEIQDMLVDLIRGAVVGTGLPAPARHAIKVMISALEFACFQRYLDPDVDRATARATMLRLALALLEIPGRNSA